MGMFDWIPDINANPENLTRAVVLQNLGQNMQAAFSNGRVPYQPLPAGALALLQENQRRAQQDQEQQQRLRAIAGQVANNPDLPEGMRSLLAAQVAAGHPKGLSDAVEYLGRPKYEMRQYGDLLTNVPVDGRGPGQSLGYVSRPEPRPVAPPVTWSLDPNDSTLQVSSLGERRRIQSGAPAAKWVQTIDPATGKSVWQQAAPGMPVAPKDNTSGNGMGKTANNQLEADYVKATTSIDNLAQSINSIDPKFLTFSGKINRFVLASKAKLNPESLTPDERSYLEGYAKFLTPTSRLLNMTVKDITGAAMNQQEVPRIKNQVPTEDDDPVTFMAKARSVMADLRLVKARVFYLRNAGIKPDFKADTLPKDVPTIDGMKTIMAGRAAALRAEAAGKGLPPDQQEIFVRDGLTREFGL